MSASCQKNFTEAFRDKKGSEEFGYCENQSSTFFLGIFIIKTESISD